MRPEFDRPQFATDVKAWLERRELSYRQAVAMHPGLNPAMLSRACTEQVLAVENFLMLCSLMRKAPLKYLRKPTRSKEKQAVTAIGKRETARARP